MLIPLLGRAKRQKLNNEKLSMDITLILTLVIALLTILNIYTARRLYFSRFLNNHLLNSHDVGSANYQFALLIKEIRHLKFEVRNNSYYINDLPVPSNMLPDVMHSIGKRIVNERSNDEIH